MTPTLDRAAGDPPQTIAELQRQLDECRAELAARNGELQEARDYQTATSDVLNVISRSTFDVQPVLDTLVATAARLCDASTSTILIRRGDLYRVVATFSHNREYEQTLRAMTFAPGRGSIAGRVALECQPVHIADLAADPEFAVPGAVTIGKVRTALGLPLLRDGEPIGVLIVLRQRVEPFTERQIELVRTFADQAVIAIENARLLGELQTRTAELAERNTAFAERIDHQAATIDVLKQMSASPADAQPVFDLICRQAKALLGTAGVRLFEYDGILVHSRATSRSASFGDPAAYAAYEAGWPRVPDRGSLSCRAILDGTIIHVRDMDAEPGVSAEVRALGNKTQVSIPLMRDGRAIGAITTSSTRVDGVSDTQIELLKTFAEQAVIAIQSAETWRELQARTRDLEESLEYQTATSDVLNVISRSTSDVQPVLDTVVETAVRLCGHRVPPSFWRRMIAEIKKRPGHRRFHRVDACLDEAAAAALAACGFDRAACGTDAWDYRSGGFVATVDGLASIAPAIVVPEAPFDRRLSNGFTDSGRARRAATRAIGFGAAWSTGWLMPMGLATTVRAIIDRTPNTGVSRS